MRFIASDVHFSDIGLKCKNIGLQYSLSSRRNIIMSRSQWNCTGDAYIGLHSPDAALRGVLWCSRHIVRSLDVDVDDSQTPQHQLNLALFMTSR